MSGILRRLSTGYRTTHPVECPSCHKPVDLAATVSEDREGKHFLIYAVAPRHDEYDAATLRHVRSGPPSEHTGVALPRPPGNVAFSDDPVPRFDGSDA